MRIYSWLSYKVKSNLIQVKCYIHDSTFVHFCKSNCFFYWCEIQDFSFLLLCVMSFSAWLSSQTELQLSENLWVLHVVQIHIYDNTTLLSFMIAVWDMSPERTFVSNEFARYNSLHLNLCNTQSSFISLCEF